MPGRPLSRQRGAALIEFAIIAPLLFALIFGVIDFGFAFNDYIQVRQGSREATRQSVTARLGSDTSCTVAAPAPTNTQVLRLICLAKNRVDLPEENVRVKINVEEPYNDRNSLQVCVMAKLQSMSGFYGQLLDSKVVQSSVQMRIEQTTDDLAAADVEDLVNFQETPLPGQTFNCTLATTV
ncbi:MAG TPA: TadE family protein [Acidimicrobiales bacterium]|nr:TadE family protein [Acidimicrobiales bacterium]